MVTVRGSGALTGAAARTRAAEGRLDTRVASRAQLLAVGCTPAEVRARLAAARWRTAGRAIVLHNGPLTGSDLRRIALINCGPRAVLTSFTAAQDFGLTGWSRPEIHVLVPAGARVAAVPEVALQLHRTSRMDTSAIISARRCHRLPPALLLAASSFDRPRPACGLLAAAGQQRLVTPHQLRLAIDEACRTRHRRALLAAVDDVAMGAQALSEIDFAALCRRHGLPAPTLQAIRRDPDGRRRYLDAEWVLRGGRRVAVEVDGAVHLAPARWVEDQLRQNEIVLNGTLVLRFPSVVVRCEPQLVVAQLRRALA